jgi:hypothetical protein
MKKPIIILLILFICNHLQAQDSKWKCLFASDTGKIPKEKTFVDTTRTTKLMYFQTHHTPIVIIWVRVYSKPTGNNEYSFTQDEKLAIDVSANQFALLAQLQRSNQTVIDQKQFDYPQWFDIFPDTLGQNFLDYARNYLNNNKD